MPIYEYQCGACGHRMEAMQKLAEAPLSICPSCSEPALNKLISAVGFRLGGSGWYETDFKSKDKRNLLEKDSKSAPAKSDDAKSSDKKSEPTSASCGTPSKGTCPSCT